MSPFSNSYSSIEEAWGMDNFGAAPVKTKKKAKKAARDPICDLYELGASPNRAYNELDVMNVVNNPRSVPSQASAPSIDMDDMEMSQPPPSPPLRAPAPPPPQSRQPPPKPFDDDEDDDDMSEFIGYIDKKTSSQRKEASNMVFPMADIGLYIISGILLIFMMEQFIKIGMMMRSY